MRTTRGRNRERSFTLLELIVALTLAALLMAAVLGVLQSLDRQREVLSARRAPAAWRQQFREQLRRDVANARRLRVQRDELRLVGYGGRDFPSGTPQHRPAEVIYAVQALGNESWLWRWEIHLDEAANQNVQGELVCADVAAITRLAIDEPPTYPANEENSADAETAPPPTAVGNHVRLVFFSTNRQITLDETVYLHAAAQD